MESATLTRPRPGTPLARLRAVPEPLAARAAFVVLCAGAAIGFLVYPTYPNYDSAYSLLWGRELVHGTLPSFDAYRAPTEHPLAVAAGAVVSLFGDAAPRVWLALVIACFCGLVAGMYRLGRTAFTPVVGLVAALLVLSRLDYPFLAARGYVDEVIEARKTRPKLIAAFRMLATKRDKNPPKKHGNIPL
ncbi:MAG: hypothetical protein HZB46_10630 [Solirubrobacterales bacterium]|nr:hypothetical protein [Solirubrobacterales bacterium]